MYRNHGMSHRAGSAPARTVKANRRRAEIEFIERRLLLSAAAAGAAGGIKTEFLNWNGERREVTAGQWIVQLNGIHGSRGHQSTLAGDLLSAAALGHGYKLGQQLVSDGMFTVNVQDQVSPQTVLADLKKLPGFKYAEPDFVYHLDTTTPNDTFFSSMWGLNNTGGGGGIAGIDIRATQAWDLSTGASNIVVADIDTGADLTHPDLVQNIYTNPG